MGVPDLPAYVVFVPVSSSNVAEIAYDAISMTLWVRFNNGKLYGYPDTAPGKWQSFLAAPSKGKWVHAHLRGHGSYDAPFVGPF